MFVCVYVYMCICVHVCMFIYVCSGVSIVGDGAASGPPALAQRFFVRIGMLCEDCGVV
jgi:hypothetical protein